MEEKEITYEELVRENKALKQRLGEANDSADAKSYTLLNLLMNSLPVLVAYIDTNFRFKLANNHYKVLHGLDPEEIIGKTIQEVIGDEGWAIEKSKYQKALQGEKVISIDNFKTKIGVFHWYQVSLIPHMEDNEVKGIFCLVIDLTDQKVMENTIRENEQNLALLNATKDKFFSIIAHDLRSPINSILGFSNLIEKSIKEQDFQNVERYSEIIQKVSKKTVDLLVNLIEWSRAQTDQVSFNPEPTDLSNLINESLELIFYSAAQKEIDISVDMPDNLKVFADKEMLKTIIRNLFSNAIKFTKPKGKIKLTINDKLSSCEISVEDNGIGMDKIALDKLFRIEESIGTTGTEDEMGTGLGLILCEEFVKKHGGEISVTSAPGKGSTFTVSLPKDKN